MERLTEKEILGARGYHAAETILLNEAETYRHTHEFYELFMINEGEVYHRCNQYERLLLPDTVCLVRPSDIHSFRKGNCKSVHFVNLAFSIELYEKCQSIWKQFYGGKEEQMEDCVRLSGGLSQALCLRIMYLMKCMAYSTDILTIDIIQGILTDSFTYLQYQKNNREIIPGWLEKTCRDMRKKENYQAGIKRFVELSGKSQEHLNRMMKKYYTMTPSAYLNSVRLERTAILLRTTDESILDIMMECGYNNVSYFNQRFKEAYGISPGRYRKLNRSVVNPD